MSVMSPSMHLELVTLLGVKLDKQVYELMASTDAGDIAVFPGHEPLVTLAKPGVLGVRYSRDDSDEKLDYFAISGGVIEISQEQVRVLVDEADHSSEFSESEARLALEKAQKLKKDAKNVVDLQNAERLIGRAAGRLKVAELHRHRHH